MTTGIYKIENLNNSKVYIGQSTNVERRIREDKICLRDGYHYNDHLQSDWDKYTEKSFSFELIKTAPKLFLDSFEKIYINNYKSMNHKYGYNIE